ncbi:MAG TPA: Spy/CpxP family protein refolding chaperone [Opitutaceae bacterium]
MKATLKVTLTLLALAVGTAVPLVRAQESTTDKPKPERREGAQGMRGDRLKMLSEQLALTAEQKTKLKPILKAEADAIRALREDTSLDRAATRSKMMELRKTHAAQIRAVLTPEQQKKFDEMQTRMRERRPHGPGGAGGPPAEPPSGEAPPR